jgi:hydrogenase-4 component E
MHGLVFDIAHVLAGSLVLVSFLQLYQDRLYALLNIFALHALVLALSVAWQAYIQDASHRSLYNRRPAISRTTSAHPPGR